MALTDKFKEIIGAIFETVNPEIDPYGDVIDEPESVGSEYRTEGQHALNPSFVETNPIESRRSKISVLPKPKAGAYEVVVIEPKAYNESITIAEALKDRKTVILNLQLLDREQSMRIVDFLCGCTHALNGSQRKIGENVFIFTPSNINISQEMVNSRLSSDAVWMGANK